MEALSRREWLKLGAVTAVGTVLSGLRGAAAAESGPSKTAFPEAGGGTLPYTLPPLPYPTDALEPVLDGRTMTIHHDKHFAGYVRGLNRTLDLMEAARAKGDFASIGPLCAALAFNGGGTLLHGLYFANLSPKPQPPKGALLKALQSQFGSLDTFKAELTAASKTVKGSGWGILAYEPSSRRLLVLQVGKHQNGVIGGAVPLLVIDVWEHAYYLKYQNRRGDYVDAIWNIIDWAACGRRFESARRGPEQRNA